MISTTTPDRDESTEEALLDIRDEVDTPLDVNTVPPDKETTPLGRSTGLDLGETTLTHRRPADNKPKTLEELSSIVPRSRDKTSYLVYLRALIETMLVQRVTVYTIFLLLIVGSIITTALAVQKAQATSPRGSATATYDDNFFSTISQGLGGILGVFCMLVPLMERNHHLQPDNPVCYPKAFKGLLGVSVATAVLSMISQCNTKPGAIVLGYVSIATQLVATLLLVIGSTERITGHRRAFDQLSVSHLVVSQMLLDLQRQAAGSGL